MEFIYVIAVIGLLIGSFLNVCICRIPKGESIANPPSHCTSCGTRLGFLDLVPVFSYLFLRGKCRHCGVSISARYPAVEVLTALVFVMIFDKYGLSVEFIACAYLMSILIAVLFIDYDHRIIPDGLVIAGLVGGGMLFVYNIFKPLTLYHGDRSWWNPLVGMFAGSGFLLLVAIVGSVVYKTEDAMGMGDVKILAPIGLFLGWKLSIVALLLSVFLGGFFSLILVVFRVLKIKSTIPFGPFIVLGTFITLIWGWDILIWYLGRLGM